MIMEKSSATASQQRTTYFAPAEGDFGSEPRRPLVAGQGKSPTSPVLRSVGPVPNRVDTGSPPTAYPRAPAVSRSPLPPISTKSSRWPNDGILHLQRRSRPAL